MKDQIFFTGCDSKYWKQYGVSFVKSFKFYNPLSTVHIHLINPDTDDLEQINNLPCEFSYEHLPEGYIDDLVESSYKFLTDEIVDTEYKSFLKFGLKFCTKYENVKDNLKDLMTFSVFAMKRFIKLSTLWNGQTPIAAYDIDTICKSPINITKMLNGKSEGCLVVKGDRFVVSLVAFSNNSKMLKEWGNFLEGKLNEKKVYGFLDQDSFVDLSKNYTVEKIPRIFCDHTKKSIGSYVMTGKGDTKYSDLFKKEQSKWR